MTGKHTPTPWAIFKAGIGEENGDGIASLWREGEEREANAALIVRAVNSHDELVKALKSLVEAVVNGTVYDAQSDPSYFNGSIDVLFEAVDVGSAALALLAGETP